MDEPVSLWDMGVFRVEQHFKSRFGESSTIEMRVAHSSNTNNLVILARGNGQGGKIQKLIAEVLSPTSEKSYL